MTSLRDVLGLTDKGEYRWSDLARYNSERARGLVHTEAWKIKMEEEQRAFDVWMRREHGELPEMGHPEYRGVK